MAVTVSALAPRLRPTCSWPPGGQLLPSVGMPTVAPGSFPQNPWLHFPWKKNWPVLKTSEDLSLQTCPSLLALAPWEEMRCCLVCSALGTTSSFTKEETNSWGFF